MLLSAFNELKTKVYLIFRCIWGRQNNTLDPAVQQQLEVFSFNWRTSFSSALHPGTINVVARGSPLVDEGAPHIQWVHTTWQAPSTSWKWRSDLRMEYEFLSRWRTVHQRLSPLWISRGFDVSFWGTDGGMPPMPAGPGAIWRPCVQSVGWWWKCDLRMKINGSPEALIWVFGLDLGDCCSSTYLHHIRSFRSWSFCSVCNDVSPRHTCHSMLIVCPAMSFLCLQWLLFPIFWSIVSNAPGPCAEDQVWEEPAPREIKICQAFAWTSFFVAPKQLVLRSSQSVQCVLRIREGIILTIFDASLDWSAHLEWCRHAITCENTPCCSVDWETCHFRISECLLEISSILVTKFGRNSSPGGNIFINVFFHFRLHSVSRCLDVGIMGLVASRRRSILRSILASNAILPNMTLLVPWLENSWWNLGNAIGHPWILLAFDIRLRLWLSWDQRWALFHVALQPARELFCLQAFTLTTRLRISSVNGRLLFAICWAGRTKVATTENVATMMRPMNLAIGIIRCTFAGWSIKFARCWVW